MKMIRTLLAISAITASLFMGTGLCPMCTFGNCNRCDMPEPEPVAEAHSCCSKEAPKAIDSVLSKEPFNCTSDKAECEGKCIEQGADTEPLPVATFELRIENDCPAMARSSEESATPVGDNALADHHNDHPPPTLHESINSTILII